MALIDAAPGSNLVLTRVIDVSLEGITHFSHYEHLLVLHYALAMMVFNIRFYMVLYLALRFLMHFMTHELETRGQVRRQHKLEGYSVVSWHKRWDADDITGVLEVNDLSLCFSLDLSLFLTSIDIVRFGVHPADLLVSLYLDHNLLCGGRHSDS